MAGFIDFCCNCGEGGSGGGPCDGRPSTESLNSATLSVSGLTECCQWPNSAIGLTKWCDETAGPSNDCTACESPTPTLADAKTVYAPLVNGSYSLTAEAFDPDNPCYRCYNLPGTKLCEILALYGRDPDTCDDCDVDPQLEYAFVGTLDCSCTDNCDPPCDPSCSPTVLIDAWLRLAYCFNAGGTGCLTVDWLYYLKVDGFTSGGDRPCEGHVEQLIRSNLAGLKGEYEILPPDGDWFVCTYPTTYFPCPGNSGPPCEFAIPFAVSPTFPYATDPVIHTSCCGDGVDLVVTPG